MRLVISAIVAVHLTLAASPLLAAGDTKSKYRGQERRPISTLSEADIAELRRGGGWGLAKPAEFNGVPGPAHLLELKDQIPLSAAQIDRITVTWKRMRSQAIPLGEQLIELERHLDSRFRDRSLTPASLRQILSQIGDVREELRFVHLSTHFQTPAMLTRDQIERYNMLRGYDLVDGQSTPPGHGREMKHGR